MTSKQSAERLIEEEEEVLQAVILADSFNKRFRPLTIRKPRVKMFFFFFSSLPLQLNQIHKPVSTADLQCTFTRLDF